MIIIARSEASLLHLFDTQRFPTPNVNRYSIKAHPTDLGTSTLSREFNTPRNGYPFKKAADPFLSRGVHINVPNTSRSILHRPWSIP